MEEKNKEQFPNVDSLMNPATKDIFDQDTKDAPEWAINIKNKIKKLSKIFITIGIVFAVLFIIFLILTIVDRVYVSSEGKVLASMPRIVWILLAFFCLFAGVLCITLGISYRMKRMIIKKVDGYYIAVNGSGSFWILYIEGQEVTRWYHRRGILETEAKLFGELPNNKRVIVTVHFRTYDEKITFEVLEKGKKI